MTARATPGPSTARATAPPRAAARPGARRGTGDAPTPKTPTRKPAQKKKPAAKKTPARRRPAKPADSPVAEALERDLKQIERVDEDLANSALAASARILARELDNPENSVTSKLTCARELRETLGRLRELVPDDQEADKLDELSRRRAKRIAGRRQA